MFSVKDFDFNTSTKVCQAMQNYGSDKGSAKVGIGWHNYTIVYNKLFAPLFEKKLRIFELGIGTTNTTFHNHMGSHTNPGSSLRAWQTLFPNSQIFGADIDREVLFEEERIKTFYCDQTSAAAIQDMWSQGPLYDQLDIIIDDGYHNFEANKTFFENSIHKLKKGGYYIIEDLQVSQLQYFTSAINGWKKTYPHLNFSLLELPLRGNDFDNTMLVIQSQGQPISKEEDVYNQLALKSPTGNRYLLYFCVFYNRDYFKLAEILLKSVYMFSKTDGIDFMIMTTDDFKDSVHAMCASVGIYVRIFTLPLKTIFQAACARLSIFDYPEIDKYEKILYIDTDIVIKGDLKHIFALPIEDRIYAIESGTIQSPSFGAQFFKAPFDPSIKGFNSGTLMFRNSVKIRDVFSRIRGHADAHADSNTTIPYCMDQPFINYHFIKCGLYDNQLLNAHVSLFEGYDEVKNEATSIVCHFSFPIGNSGHKLARMKKYFSQILESKKGTVGDVNPVGKSYTWGTGQISFTNSGLWTTWAKGEYEALGSNWFRVYWSNYYHVIKMNADFTEYTGIRVWPGEFEVCTGTLIKK
jgi:hypothetical protein